MFTSPLANKHFDFNARYIQLPVIHPMTATTCSQHEGEMEDITMTETTALGAAAAPADDHGALYFMDIDQEMSLWNAAYTLLDLHHAATTRHRSDQSTCTTTTATTITSPSAPSSSSSSSSFPPSSTTENPEESSESSNSSSSGCQRLRRQQQLQRRQPPSQPRPRPQQQQQQHRHTAARNGTSTTGIVSKPRWSDEERNKLLMAVIEEKGLEQLTTFDWQRVARGVRNQTSTTCRDRWRDHLLPILHQLYQSRHDSFSSSSFSSSSSPISSNTHTSYLSH